MCLQEIVNRKEEEGEEYVIRRRELRGSIRERESEGSDSSESSATPENTGTPSGRVEFERLAKRARRRIIRRRLDFNNIDHPGKENIRSPLKMARAGEKVKSRKRLFTVTSNKLPKFLHLR